MKYSLLIVLMLVILCTPMTVSAQADNQRVSLNVGDRAPRLMPLKWIKGEPTDEFKKGHIYIVEFGATWCAPCAAAIPELTALARKYQGKVTVIGVFVMEYHNDPPGTKVPSYLKKVEKYVAKQGDKMQYNVAVDDPMDTMSNAWIKAAGKHGIPHTFVIDGDGKVAWIGSNPKALANVVQSVVSKKYAIGPMIERDRFVSSMKKEYNLLKLLNKEDRQGTLYFSHLSVYREGQTGIPNYPFVDNFLWAQRPEIADRQGKIQVLGETLRRLYYMAYGDTLWNRPPSMSPPDSGIYPDTVEFPHQKRCYGKYWYRPILEVSDSSFFEADYTSAKNRFNYVLSIPLEETSSMLLREIMQRDLETCFGYEVTVEERMMPYWKLTVSSEAKAKLQTRTPGAAYRIERDDNGTVHKTNAQVRDLIFQLEIKYGYSMRGNLVHHPDKQPPFIDATGITGKIDYSYDADLMKRLIRERKYMNNFEAYRKWLSQIGFNLERSYKKMKVVVIRDQRGR
jgi:thiol-disulfide isomerase/thioredoxin